MAYVKTITCTVCPRGCSLQVTQTQDSITVEGATCKRGEAYGKEEIIDPRRMLTTSVWVQAEDGSRKRLPVRSSDLVPLRLFPHIMQELHRLTPTAPVSAGQILLRNVQETGVDMIASTGLQGKGWLF